MTTLFFGLLQLVCLRPLGSTRPRPSTIAAYVSLYTTWTICETLSPCCSLPPQKYHLFANAWETTEEKNTATCPPPPPPFRLPSQYRLKRYLMPVSVKKEEKKEEKKKEEPKDKGHWREIWLENGSRIYEHTGTKRITCRDMFK